MRRIAVVLVAAAAALAAGCAPDVPKQIASNEQFRTQVMTTIAGSRTLAFEQVDKLAAVDSLRPLLVDHLLGNEEVAKQVLVRIGTNPQALDLCMQIAMRDTAMREHVFTLMKGIQMASGK